MDKTTARRIAESSTKKALARNAQYQANANYEKLKKEYEQYKRDRESFYSNNFIDEVERIRDPEGLVKNFYESNDDFSKVFEMERPKIEGISDKDLMEHYEQFIQRGDISGDPADPNAAIRAIEREKLLKEIEEGASQNRATKAIASIASIPVGLVGGVLQPFTMVKDSPLYTDGKNYVTEAASALREGASQDLGDFGKFLYNTGLSALESALAALVPYGGGLALLGLSAASQASNDIIDRGGSNIQAAVGGIAAGAFEGFFERFSISALKSMQLDEITTSWKAFTKNMGKQVLTNASEESATEIANIAFDTIAMGDISNAAIMIENYMAQGMTEREAILEASKQFALQTLESAASGGLMGAGFGAVGAGFGAVRRTTAGGSIVNDKGTKLSDLIEAGEQTFVGDRYAGERELVETIKKNESKTNAVQRNRVQKLDDLLTLFAREKAKDAVSWSEQKKQIREDALNDVSSTIKNAEDIASKIMTGKDITYNAMPKISDFSDADLDKIVITKSNGEQDILSTQTFEDEEIAQAYILATSTGSVDNANRFIEQFRLHRGETSVEEFWSVWMGVQNYGQTVTSEGAMEKAIERYSSYALPETALQSAFLSGRSLRQSADAKYKEQQQKYEKAWKEAGGTLTDARFDDSEIRGKKLDNTQQEYRSFLRVFSRATGTNIEVFFSEKGQRKENGSYNRDTNTLRIDINAGIKNNANYSATKSSIINTLSHETVHNMRVTAPEQYAALRDYVTAILREDNNYNLDEAIEAEIERYRQKGQNISREDAIEEIVARACEDRLGSSEALRDFMIDFYAHDEKAANSFIKVVREFIARLKSFFEKIAKQMSRSEEAVLISQQGVETISELQTLFDEAILAMREGNAARNANISIDVATESASPIMLSEATWRESEYVTNREKAAKALANALNVSEEDALKYIDNVNSVAKMIANDRVRLDYVASSFGSAFVSNTEYGGSFDFTTLCKKRRIYTGTFSEIQKRIGEVALSPEQILEIRNLLIDARYEATCGLCYVEGSRANMGKFAKEFIRLYRRDNAGRWIPKMVDVNTPDGVEQMRINHPECYDKYVYFWDHYGRLKEGDPALFASQQKPKLYEARKAYKNEILSLFTADTKVESKNRNGGIRMQSFSDFELVHAIDTMQVIMDMSRVGLAGQAYTKVPEFAMAFGDTGLKINLSLIAKGVDENGKLIFDDREGMPHETAFELRKKHSQNVGTILVIFNDKQLYAAMADRRIDFIIPFHRSQWKKGQYAAMGLPEGTKDYTYMQNEKLIKPTYHEYRGRMVKDKANNYMPNEYWRFDLSGKENAEIYLDMCARENKRPKFYKLLDYDGKGRYSLKADGSTDGYWKLLIDFKMYDNAGNGSPQMPVVPKFAMNEIRKMLREYEGGHSSYPIAHDVVDKFMQSFSAKTVAESSTLLTQPIMPKISTTNIMLQDRDSDYLDAVENGDMETAQRMVDEAAKEAGYEKLYYHGTVRGDFTTFKSHGKPIWVTEDESYAMVYSNSEQRRGYKENERVMELLIQKGNVLDVTSVNTSEFIFEDFSRHKNPTDEFKKLATLIGVDIGALEKFAKKGAYLRIWEIINTKNFADIAREKGYNTIREDEFGNITYGLLFPAQLKAANPVTYDDKGNIIPLSERFNVEDSDIRYQERETDESTLESQRIETPEPSDVLRQYFANNETYEGYKPYVESLKKYRNLLERVDAYEAKITTLDGDIARLRSQHRQEGKGTRIDDLHKQRNQIEKKIDEVKKRMFAMEAKELRKVVDYETRTVVSEARRDERERLAERGKSRRENASKRQYIESISKRVKRMQEMFVKNNAEKHIPEALKTPIAELLTALDFSSRRSISGGDPTKREIALKEAVQRIKEISETKNQDGLPALDLPPRFQKQWDEVMQTVNALTTGKGKMYPDQMILEEMSSTDLRLLNRALMDIQHAVSVANEIISEANSAPINELAGTLAAYLDTLKDSKAEGRGLKQTLKTFTTWENTLPVYAFDRLGSVGEKLFVSFQNGFDQLVGEVNQVIDYTKSLYSEQDVKKWREEVHTFECESLTGEKREIHLTIPDIMSFYCLSKRDHAIPHFKGGGIVAEDINLGTHKESYSNDARGVRLTDETIFKIIGTLSEEQRTVADKLQEFMNTVCSDWGNEISMKRYGIRMYTEENYFPIKTKSSTRDIVSAESPQNTKMYAILNMSFTKPLTEEANNQLVIEDIFDVFAKHAGDMARYHSLALPVLDYMKVYNFKEKMYSGDIAEDGEGLDKSFEQTNVRDSLKNAYGSGGVKYFESFITNISGANWTQDSNTLANWLTKGAKVSMVGFNMRTVVQQPTAAVRALMYLGFDDMSVTLTPSGIKEARELALKYCPMAKWKSMGYFDIGTGRGLSSMIANTATVKDKTIEASMYLAGKADEYTWAYLWKACEHWVSQRHKDLTQGTEAYYKAVGEKLREVIYRTQVVDSPLTKSQFMSSPNEYKKMTAMFAAEPTVTYNMILNVFDNISRAKKQHKSTAKYRKMFVKLVGVYSLQAILLAAVQSAMDAMRDDDDEKNYGEKYLESFLENVIAEANPGNKLPIFRDFFSTLEGFTVARTDTTLFSKMSYTIKDIYKVLSGKEVSAYKVVYNALVTASTATGIAASNILRDVVALWNTVVGAIFPHLKIKK